MKKAKSKKTKKRLVSEIETRLVSKEVIVSSFLMMLGILKEGKRILKIRLPRHIRVMLNRN